MRLSSFPYVILRIGCSRCERHGQYRLARLADRYGAEMPLVRVLDHLAADCKFREGGRPNIYDRCGAYLIDLDLPRPPDAPATARPGLRVVKR